MKKILYAIILTVVLGITQLYANPYYLFMSIYNYDETSGTATSANDFSSVSTYRAGISGEIGHQESGPNPTYPQEVYPYSSPNPAYLYSDVGSSDWATTAVAAGQTIVAVAEVYNPQFGWTGSSYVTCGQEIITGTDINNSTSFLPDTQLQLIPAPIIVQEDSNSITVSWTGMSNNYIVGYSLYRTTAPTTGPSGSYTPITVVPQSAGNIQYTDNTGLVYGTTYYYEIAVDFVWGGTGNTVTAYVSDAMSSASNPVQIATYTATATVSGTSTITATITETETEFISETPTYTPSVTETEFLSETPTYTLTNTQTITATETETEFLSETPTYTLSATQTVTATYTETEELSATPTYTMTNTPEDTATTTNTPEDTLTNTPQDTDTNTPVNTVTNTPQDTATETITPTFTSAMSVTFTETSTIVLPATATDTPIAVPSSTQTPIETSTPGCAVFAYPNPVKASSSVNINYCMKQVQPIEIDMIIYAINGDKAAEITEMNVFNGILSFDLNKKLAPGVYFYKLTVKYIDGSQDIYEFKKLAVVN